MTLRQDNYVWPGLVKHVKVYTVLLARLLWVVS